MSNAHGLFGYAGRHHAHPVTGEPALRIRDLSVTHPGAALPSLCAINLQVQIGERIALVGPNGAGKSTLLKAVAGLIPTRPGQIFIYGNPVGACHHRVSYLEQRSDVDWTFPVTLRKLVLTGRYVHLGWFRRPSTEDHRIANAAIERLALTDLADRQIGELSGGQQQRALLARALAQEADLLLFDEPLNALDSATRGTVLEVLRELHQQKKTLVMSTHDLHLLEDEFDQAFHLEEGKLADPCCAHCLTAEVAAKNHVVAS
jgi:ABC-type Mn2+/Zn2+ transport system ATPase subunit